MAALYNFPNSNGVDNYINVREFIEDFYSIFPDIKRFINRIFFLDNSVFADHSKKPFVDIYNIAQERVGIDMIWEIPEKVIGGKHATIHRDIVNGEIWTIILLNKNDSQEEKNFSIGHEIFHHIFRDVHRKDMPVITKKINIWTEQLFQKYKEKPFILRKDYDQTRKVAAREDNQNKREKPAARINPQGEHPKKRDPNNIEDLKKDIEDDIENEIADYFAANLVVPVERFILWEDKSIGKIARAFRVDEKCIKKRMTEIPFELDFIKSLDTELEA
jgi:hypothetical protein